jgi:hypothetical protein
MKNKKQKIYFIVFALLFAFLVGSFATQAATGSYTPMEAIPGFGRPKDFPTYLMSIYKFGLWAIGICALLMITIGGYMYLISAGNKASAETAKKVITDAIAGIILALVSWLLLYLINPDLVKLTFPGATNQSTTTPATSTPTGSGTTNQSTTTPATSTPTSSGATNQTTTPNTSAKTTSWYFKWSRTYGLSNSEDGPFSSAEECQASRQKKTSLWIRTYDCTQR